MEQPDFAPFSWSKGRDSATSEERDKLRFFGAVVATMTGLIKECTGIWERIGEYLVDNPGKGSVSEISDAAYEYVCSLKKGSSEMFIASIEQRGSCCLCLRE